MAVLCLFFFLKPEDRGKENRTLIAEIIIPKAMPTVPPEHERVRRPARPERKISIPKTAEQPGRLSEVPAKRSQRKTPGAGRVKQNAQQATPEQKQPHPDEHQKPFTPSRKYATPHEQGQESGRSRLFDRDVITEATRNREEPKDESSLTFNTKDYKYYGYMQRLREKIENVWRYPVEAGAKGIYGDLYIRFTITKSGKLGAVELVRTSGNRHLDNAALKALRDAEPFWPLPEDWGREGLTITGHFVYTLRGSYIK